MERKTVRGEEIKRVTSPKKPVDRLFSRELTSRNCHTYILRSLSHAFVCARKIQTPRDNKWFRRRARDERRSVMRKTYEGVCTGCFKEYASDFEKALTFFFIFRTQIRRVNNGSRVPSRELRFRRGRKRALRRVRFHAIHFRPLFHCHLSRIKKFTTRSATTELARTDHIKEKGKTNVENEADERFPCRVPLPLNSTAKLKR